MKLVTRRLLLPILALFLSFAASSTMAAGGHDPAKNGYHKQRVVYHLNDAEVAGMALRNIQNHINALGEGNAEITVVTHGKGIDFLLDGWKDSKGKAYDTQVQNLVNQGVTFNVCNNTLNGRKIDKDTVNMNAVVVPSGVATVGELQLQGFVYVKP